MNKDLENSKLIALLRVDEGEIIYRKGVANYDTPTGWVTLSDYQDGMLLVPLVTDTITGQDYLTTKHFIRSITADGKVRVWRTALDTGDRDWSPSSFTLAVHGLY